jgi:hypothetical protein
MIEPLVVSNFITEPECKRLISFIENNVDDFETLVSERRMMLFGYDTNYTNPRLDTELLDSVKDILAPVLDRLLVIVRENLDPFTVGTSTVFFAKQTKENSGMRAHIDAEDNDEFYNASALVYLNTPEGGEVYFPDQNLFYFPKAGDLVVFSSTTLHEPRKTMTDKYLIAFNLTDFNDFIFHLQ